MDHQPYSPEDLLKAIDDDRLYDYVASHYYEMDKDDLKDVILELTYALSDALSKADEKAVLNSARSELADRWDI